MKFNTKNMLVGSLPLFCAAVIGLFFALTLSANDDKQGELKKLVVRINEEIDETQRELADEYLEILGELDEIIDDYSEYFEKFDETDKGYLREQNLSFRTISLKLERGNYLSHPEDLKIDMNSMIELLRQLHGDHRHVSDCRERCRLLRNLDRELSILSRHIELYLSIQTRQELRQEKTIIYLKTNLSSIINDALEIAMLDLEVTIDALREIDGKIVVTAPVPELPEAPDVPNVPDPGTMEIRISRIGYGHDDISGTRQSFIDSLQVSSSKSKILISNPMGNIRITGWDKPTIVASLQIEVTSRSNDREKEFISATELVANKSAKGYEIFAKFPTLKDTRTRLISSSLIVRVPRKNFAIVKNSFGEISMSDMSGGVNITSKHSEINLDNISGGTEIESSMGVIRLTGITGNISINCSYGEIELTDCRSNIRLESKYSDLRISDCVGSGRLSGSGNVYIQGFVGSLDISNSYGTVEIRDVDGDLDATNAYDALIVRDVSGSAVLENSYSRVDVYQIGGTLNISNTHGPIFAEAFEGPIDIENENGNIKIILDRSLGGTSRILNNGGNIDLAFLRRGNFVVVATAINGAINSHLPLHVSREGNKRTASLSFGSGLDSLLLLVRGSDINIIKSN